MTETPTPQGWDLLCPNGRNVYYEGTNPTLFAAAMLQIGIDVTESGNDWTVRRSFFIPAGRVEEIYGSGRWPLGS